jgi:hypothetical protein
MKLMQEHLLSMQTPCVDSGLLVWCSPAAWEGWCSVSGLLFDDQCNFSQLRPGVPVCKTSDSSRLVAHLGLSQTLA